MWGDLLLPKEIKYLEGEVGLLFPSWARPCCAWQRRAGHKTSAVCSVMVPVPSCCGISWWVCIWARLVTLVLESHPSIPSCKGALLGHRSCLSPSPEPDGLLQLALSGAQVEAARTSWCRAVQLTSANSSCRGLQLPCT